MNLSNQTAVDSALSQSVLAQAICIPSAAIFLFFATCAQSDDLTTLYSFDGTNGSNPHYGLVKGADGNFYGTAGLGGTNSGTGIFRITASGALTWVHKFTGGTNGDNPNRLLLGTDGNFYGTTYSGGTTNYNSFGTYGYGTVFRMTAGGTLITLYSFKADSVGCYPSAGLVQAKDGSFYGVTRSAGIQPGSYNGFGTVFKITTDGRVNPVYAFPGSELGFPSAELVEGSDGDLYGTIYGVFEGRVFKLGTNGTLRWVVGFTGDCQINCGSRPNAGLVIAADGSSLYGTTSSGGFPDSTLRGYGTVFKITTNGILSTLFLFNNNLYGARPSSTLVRMTYSKIFYGMTASTIFRLIGTNVTLEWGAIGASPSGPLLQSGEGTFYGTGRLGGAFGKGNIFRLSVSTPLLSTPPVFITPTLNGGNVTLRWSVVADQTFQVQYKTNLTETVWSNLGSAIGTNATSDAVGPGARFYRVVLLP